MNIQTSSPSVAVTKAVTSPQSTSTGAGSGSAQSGTWLKLGPDWLIQSERAVVIGYNPSRGRVQVWLETGQSFDIEPEPGNARVVIRAFETGEALPPGAVRAVDCGQN